MPKVIQPEQCDLAAFDRCGVCGVHLHDRGLSAAAGKEIVTFDLLVVKPFDKTLEAITLSGILRLAAFVLAKDKQIALVNMHVLTANPINLFRPHTSLEQ